MASSSQKSMQTFWSKPGVSGNGGPLWLLQKLSFCGLLWTSVLAIFDNCGIYNEGLGWWFACSELSGCGTWPSQLCKIKYQVCIHKDSAHCDHVASLTVSCACWSVGDAEQLNKENVVCLLVASRIWDTRIMILMNFSFIEVKKGLAALWT